MTTRESIELFAIVLGIGVAFIIHFGFGDSPSIESSTPRLKPAVEFDFNRPKRTAESAPVPSASRPARKRKRASAGRRTPVQSPETQTFGQSPSGSFSDQAAPPQTAPAPAAREPSAKTEAPSKGRSSPAGGGSSGERFDDSG